MAWLYSPGLPDSKEALVLSSEAPTEPCVMLNGTLTPRPRSWHGWRTRRWIELLSTTTFPPSILDRGVDAWISSLEAFHAPMSQTPAQGRASGRETGPASGMSTKGSFATWNPLSSGWKTSRPSQGEDSTSFLEALPSSGSMRNGSLSKRPMWVPPIAVRGSSSSPRDGTAWTSPTAEDADARKRRYAQGGTPLSLQGAAWPTPQTNPQAPNANSNQVNSPPCLEEAARLWPSPRAEDSENCGNHPGQQDSLTGRVKLWPTALAKDADAAGNRPANGVTHPGTSLSEAIREWPTPRASAGEQRTHLRPPSHDARHGKSLASETAHWPTPNARDLKGTDIPGRHGGASLSHYVETGQRSHSSPQDPASGTSGMNSSPSARTSPLRLNPAFVCWLMGYPWWWTRAERISFAAMEMESWNSRQRSLLRSLIGGLGQDSPIRNSSPKDRA